MRPPGPGVWITGPSRSGTSMVAGLFAAHGVFFGETTPADEHNEKGYFEHPEIVERVEAGLMAGWPESWWETLRAEGYGNAGYWGVKRGPVAWPWVRLLFPELIVFCKRPMHQILRSRDRWQPWASRSDAFRPAVDRAIRKAHEEMETIASEASCAIVTVNTDVIVTGNYQRLNKAFGKLGLWLDIETCDGWIDRSLWNRGPGQEVRL